MSPAVSHTPAREAAPRWLLHAGFVLTGVVAVVLGPILPELAARWSLTDARAGLFFTAQFFGAMSGVACSSVLLPRRGFRLTLALSFAAMAAGIGALGIGPWAAGLLATYVCGIGLGLIIPSANLWMAEANPHRRAAALSLLNLAWVAGAAGCPPLAMLALGNGGLRVLLVGLGVAAGAMVVWTAVGRGEMATASPESADAREPLKAHDRGNRLAVTLGALFYLYVGTESAVAGWAASYAKRMSETPGTFWVLTPSCFWGALLLGRALAPLVLRRAAEKSLVLAGLVLTALGTGWLIGATTFAAALAATTLAGLGLAAIYPILVAWLAEYLGAVATRIGGAYFALGGLGGATLPWLVGTLSTHWSSLRAGLAVPLLGSVVMMALLELLPRRAEPRPGGIAGAR